MLECKQYVVRNLAPDKRKSLNYTELGRQAMGAFGKWAVDASVLLCNLGVCAGYMIFISGNLRVRKGGGGGEQRVERWEKRGVGKGGGEGRDSGRGGEGGDGSREGGRGGEGECRRRGGVRWWGRGMGGGKHRWRPGVRVHDRGREE